VITGRIIQGIVGILCVAIPGISSDATDLADTDAIGSDFLHDLGTYLFTLALVSTSDGGGTTFNTEFFCCDFLRYMWLVAPVLPFLLNYILVLVSSLCRKQGFKNGHSLDGLSQCDPDVPFNILLGYLTAVGVLVLSHIPFAIMNVWKRRPGQSGAHPAYHAISLAFIPNALLFTIPSRLQRQKGYSRAADSASQKQSASASSPKCLLSQSGLRLTSSSDAGTHIDARNGNVPDRLYLLSGSGKYGGLSWTIYGMPSVSSRSSRLPQSYTRILRRSHHVKYRRDGEARDSWRSW